MKYLIHTRSLLLAIIALDAYGIQDQQPIQTIKENGRQFERACLAYTKERVAKKEQEKKGSKIKEEKISLINILPKIYYYVTHDIFKKINKNEKPWSLLLNDNRELYPLEKYQKIASTGFDFKKPDHESGWTLLHHAVDYRDLPLIKWLIEEQKVEINAFLCVFINNEPHATTPLDRACRFVDEESEKDLAVISYLVTHGAQFSGNYIFADSYKDNPRILQTYVAALSAENKRLYCKNLEKLKRNECGTVSHSNSKQCKNICASIEILQKSLSM